MIGPLAACHCLIGVATSTDGQGEAIAASVAAAFASRNSFGFRATVEAEVLRITTRFAFSVNSLDDCKLLH